MKAKNSEKIIRGYLEFAGGLLISTALSMALLTGFIHTNGSEYKLMESKTQEYDKIYARQIALVDKVDSLYNYLVLMGSNDRLNQVVLQKVISTRKMYFCTKNWLRKSTCFWTPKKPYVKRLLKKAL